MAVREPAERDGDGVVVRLVWDDAEPLAREVVVADRDERRGESFTLHPPRHRALDAMYRSNAHDSRKTYAPGSLGVAPRLGDDPR